MDNLLRQRARLRAHIRTMPEGPKKEAARRRFERCCRAVWFARQGHRVGEI